MHQADESSELQSADDIVINQELAELTKCYSNVDLPARVDQTLDPSLTFEQSVLAFGAAARQAIHAPALQRYLAANAARAVSDRLSDEALTEFFWFLFSQKDWSRIRTTAELIGNRLGDLPLHIADLIFLAFYRSQRERLLAGKDADGFAIDGNETVRFLRVRWPGAERHVAAFDAMVTHATGNAVQARRTFVSLGDLSFIEPFAGISSVLLESEYQSTAIPDRDIEVMPSAAEHVTLLSLDPIYFEKYAHLVARRYSKTNPSNGLHFHCVGFDPRKAFASWDLPTSFGFTIDRTDLSHLAIRQQRGYFASSRYIHLARYLQIYQSVFVGDVDGHVARDVREMHGEHADLDIILSTKVLDNSRILNRLPWESITACSFMARRTPGARRFANRVGSYLQTIVQNARTLDRPIWYADQAALFYSWLDSEHDVRFGTFNKTAFVQRGSWQLFQGEKERLDFLANP